MIIIWGSRLYGRVDDIPGGFHVATRFGHLWYVPLIPMGSTLVIEQNGSQYRGVPIPLSAKSILWAWVKAAMIVGGLGMLIFGLTQFADPTPRQQSPLLVGVTAAILGVLCFAGAFFIGRTRFIRRASYSRAVQLAELAGMSEEGLIMIEAAYGRISEEEARSAISQMTHMTQEAVQVQAGAQSAPSTPPMAPPPAHR